MFRRNLNTLSVMLFCQERAETPMTQSVKTPSSEHFLHPSVNLRSQASKFPFFLFSCTDVYSYDEDDMVLDPNLAEHLAHFGIDMLKMQKVRRKWCPPQAQREREATLRCLIWIPAFHGYAEPFLVKKPCVFLSQRELFHLPLFFDCLFCLSFMSLRFISLGLCVSTVAREAPRC